MTADEILDDLRDRLVKAADGLQRMAAEYAEHGTWDTARRLDGKAQGVRLALSYIHDYNRQEEP